MRAFSLNNFRLNDPAYAGSFRISAQLSVFGRVTLLVTSTRYRSRPSCTALYARLASFSFEMKNLAHVRPEPSAGGGACETLCAHFVRFISK